MSLSLFYPTVKYYLPFCPPLLVLIKSKKWCYSLCSIIFAIIKIQSIYYRLILYFINLMLVLKFSQFLYNLILISYVYLQIKTTNIYIFRFLNFIRNMYHYWSLPDFAHIIMFIFYWCYKIIFELYNLYMSMRKDKGSKTDKLDVTFI